MKGATEMKNLAASTEFEFFLPSLRVKLILHTLEINTRTEIKKKRYRNNLPSLQIPLKCRIETSREVISNSLVAKKTDFTDKLKKSRTFIFHFPLKFLHQNNE